MYNLSLFLFEVPTGVISDLVSRKLSIFLGFFCLITGIFSLFLAEGFSFLALGQITFALGTAFISGSDEALIYDSLLSKKREKEFTKIWSRIMLSSGIGCVFSLFISGEMTKYFSIRGIIFINAIVFFIPLVLTLFLNDIRITSDKKETNYFLQITESAKIVFKSSEILLITSLISLVLAFTKSVLWLSTPLFLRIDFPESEWGKIFSINRLIGVLILFSIYKKLEKKNLNKLIILFSVFYPILLLFFY